MGSTICAQCAGGARMCRRNGLRPARSAGPLARLPTYAQGRLRARPLARLPACAHGLSRPLAR
nr:hypothetical protein [Kibdelosporangium sp. MJ126-NF4]CTQ95213.1 hypothetical protein [Kibdelosporangium sp. MJ126-NF4]